jgi:transposase
MYNTTIFVGMDVHKETFSLCCYSIEKDEFSHPHTTEADYKHVLSSLASLRAALGGKCIFYMRL